MESLNYTIKDEYGLHARPASKLVEVAQRYQSSVEIKCRNGIGNGKNMISVLKLGIRTGDMFEIQIVGIDETEACLDLKCFLEESRL